MKRYTVKQVVKMEERQLKLHKIDSAGDAEFYFMPLALLTTMGASFLLGASESAQLVPLIIGSASTIFGGGSLAHLFSAGLRSDLLYEKINKIYDIMGVDFKKQVEEEMFRQQDEENKRSR